ncbi:AMP-binding protein, partial [Nocardiopsis dassonvillei]|nr:AMP-binding protein [Nocardiopsis dassonvillei]
MQTASIGFDGSVWEIAMGLLTGGCVVVGRPEDLLDAKGVTGEAGRITHLTVTPSMLAALPDDGLPPGAVVVTASEAVTEHVVQRWARDHRLINSYGPTETTVCASGTELRPGEPVTIGGPVAGTRLFVLD